MNNQNEVLSCEQAKALDLVEYLHSLGYQPKKIRGVNYWYLSPLRVEKTPSFKVDRHKNLWFDHGVGKGGTLIDFGIQYYSCSIPELLEKLSSYFSFHQPLIELHSLSQYDGDFALAKSEVINDAEKRSEGERKYTVEIQQVFAVTSFHLERYLHSRNIPLPLGKTWLKELRFSIREKQYNSLGFLNDSGGYELRSQTFKGSSLPKDITTVKRGSDNLSVFECFFDFLSLLSMHPNEELLTGSFLILNSLSFIQKSVPFLDSFPRVSLFLDQDLAGRKQTEYLLSQSNRYRDESSLYNGYKDLSE